MNAEQFFVYGIGLCFLGVGLCGVAAVLIAVNQLRKEKKENMKTLFGNVVNVGFTGTQQGMNKKQRTAFMEVIQETGVTHFHHGDCIGADENAHRIVRNLWPDPNKCKIVGHPPVYAAKRAHCKFDFCLPPDEYIKRNHAIVDCCELMIATPYEKDEQLRSGTWATIRYAKKKGKRLIIVYRDGSVVR